MATIAELIAAREAAGYDQFGHKTGYEYGGWRPDARAAATVDHTALTDLQKWVDLMVANDPGAVYAMSGARPGLNDDLQAMARAAAERLMSGAGYDVNGTYGNIGDLMGYLTQRHQVDRAGLMNAELNSEGYQDRVNAQKAKNYNMQHNQQWLGNNGYDEFGNRIAGFGQGPTGTPWAGNSRPGIPGVDFMTSQPGFENPRNEGGFFGNITGRTPYPNANAINSGLFGNFNPNMPPRF